MDNQTEAENKRFTEFFRNPARSECEGRFLSLAAQLVREGYAPRIVAQAGLNVGLEQAEAESWLYYRHFLENLETLSRTLVARLDEEAAEAEASAAAAPEADTAALAAMQPAGEA